MKHKAIKVSIYSLNSEKDTMGLGVFALSLYQLLLPSLNIWHFVFHQDRFDTQQFIYTIAMY